MILTCFLTALRNAVYGDSVTMPTHIMVGTGTTAVVATDTALETEILPDGSNRKAISSRTKPSATKVRMQIAIGMGEANGSSLTEVGAVNAATSGTAYNRIVHTAIAKDVSFELLTQIETTFYNVA